MQIQNRASSISGFLRPTISFESARSAFKAFLKELEFAPNECILLPAFVGYSRREGSGVLDPIQESGRKFVFYRVRRDLSIDLEHLHQQLVDKSPKLLVLIHYYGYPDKNINSVVALARQHKVLILEDEAHAMYSDWIGGACGRFGDACIMSLHKMLPFKDGGLLILNPTLDTEISDRLKNTPYQKPLEYNLRDYDLLTISTVRRMNALKLHALLQPLAGRVDLLHKTIPDDVTPQTLPVLISGRSRDELYFELNSLGYGVVSLYHTMVSSLDPAEFPESHWLARHILNLPVHQDINGEELENLVEALDSLIPTEAYSNL